LGRRRRGSLYRWRGVGAGAGAACAGNGNAKKLAHRREKEEIS
jgi:hypothetical protein